jgi:phosphoglycolate phosphatase-like HAD superfamily hydrolase
MEAELDTEGKIFLNIVFWDIDGTLIRTGKAGLFAFQAAAAERGLGPVDYRQVQAAGMTDYSIASQILEKLAGQSVTHQAVRELADRYEELLPEHLEQHEGRVLPSVRDILAALRETGTISLLLTGNSRKGAEVKMRKFGLESYFDFERSAFCENSQTRDDVAGRALLSVQEMAVTQAARVFVIGDTPNDIRCGKNIGAYTIGVATGTFSEIDLSKHEPWWVTKQLPSATEFMARLFDAVPMRFQR